MPGPLLDAYINRQEAVRAQAKLDLAEAVLFGMAGYHGSPSYVAWVERLRLLINGDLVRTPSGRPESVLSIRARREAGRAERERLRRQAAPA